MLYSYTYCYIYIDRFVNNSRGLIKLIMVNRKVKTYKNINIFNNNEKSINKFRMNHDLHIKNIIYTVKNLPKLFRKSSRLITVCLKKIPNNIG